MSTGEYILCFVIFIVALGLITLSDKPDVKKFDAKKYWNERENKWRK